MKYKLWFDRKTGSRQLRIESDKGSQYAYADAKRVLEGEVVSFLQFRSYVDKNTYVFDYSANGLVTLDELLSRTLEAGQLRNLLISLLQIITSCERNGLSRLRVLYEGDKAFVDPASGALRLAYIPLHGIDAPGDEATLLRYICDHGDFSRSDIALARASYDFARQTTLITSSAFEAFLRRMNALPEKKKSESARIKSRGSSGGPTDERTKHGYDFVANQIEDTRDDGTETAGMPPESLNVEPDSHGNRPNSAASTDILESGSSEPANAEANIGSCQLTDLSTNASWRLSTGEYTLGRAQTCDICVESDRLMSRVHARLLITASACTIEDLASKNGTSVNGIQLSQAVPITLNHDDIVAVGSTRLLFKR